MEEVKARGYSENAVFAIRLALDEALNNAISEVLPHLKDEARANPHAEMLIRVLAFANEPRWVIEEPSVRMVPVMTWKSPLSASDTRSYARRSPARNTVCRLLTM